SPGSHDQAGAEPPAGDDQAVVVGGGDAGAREARGAGVGADLGPGGGARAVLVRQGLRVRVRVRGHGQPPWTAVTNSQRPRGGRAVVAQRPRGMTVSSRATATPSGLPSSARPSSPISWP